MNLDNNREKELISDAVGLISKKWHSRIIYYLLKQDSANFSELLRNLDDISNKVLSNSLNDLRDKELIQKIEDSGSTTYKLTDKGKDLEPVFDSIADWSEKYLAAQRPEILIVEDNEQQARMYKRWLESAYDVNMANKSSEIFSGISDTTDIVLLDRKLPETSAEELLESSDVFEGKQVIMITGMEPGLEIVRLDVDDYIIKPISREDLKEAVNRSVKAVRGTEKEHELISLVSKKKALDRNPRSVRETEEYKELVERIKVLKQEIDRIPDIVEQIESS